MLIFAPLAISTVAVAETTIEDTSAVGELAYWNKVKASEDPVALKLYLDTFPQGMFYDIALSKYLAAGGSPAKLEAPPSKAEVVVDEPADDVVEDQPVQKTYEPKIRVQKRKQAYFKPKSDYRKIQKIRYVIKKRAAKRYEPVYVYKRPAVKKRIVCAGYWSNGHCVVKPKYAKVKVRYAKPKKQYAKTKYEAPPKPKKVYDPMEGGQGSSGGGGGGGGWNN